MRWYELRNPGGTPTVYQQGTYAPDSRHRWMGSVAMDRNGDIALGYSISSSSQHPAIGYTGRLAGDPLGVMTQGEATLVTGGGSQNGGLSRWGDYTSMSVDPSDDCTFWYTNEYIAANGSFNWHTRVGSFQLPGCTGTTTQSDFSIAASPTSLSVQQGGSGGSTISTAVTSGSAQSVGLSASGQPAGTTVSFSPSSVTAGGSSTMTINVGASTATGSYTITVTGTGTNATHTITVALTVAAPPAIARVNTAKAANGGTPAASLTTGTFAATAGDLLVVAVRIAGFTSAAPTISDTALDTFTPIASVAVRDPSLYLFYAKNINGNAANAVTATFDNIQYDWLYVVQYSGVDPTAPLDLGGATTDSGTDLTTDAFSTAASGEVVVVFASQNTISTFTAGADFTLVDGSIGTDTYSYGGAEEYITGTSLSSYTAHITASVGAPNSIAWASFKPRAP
jgi:hypothetical protein